MNIITHTFNYLGKEITLETGKVARQADSAVVIRSGDTYILSTAVVQKGSVNNDFFPLTVHYFEKSYAAGRIPGSFFRREAKPSEREILISRLIDRPIRPMFPDGFMNEIQLVQNVFSVDKNEETDILALIVSSACMATAGVPMISPIGAARVAYIDGKITINPTRSEMKNSKLDMVIAGTEEAIMMVESEAHELSSDIMVEALSKGHEALKIVVREIKEFAKKVNKTTISWESKLPHSSVLSFVKENFSTDIAAAYKITDKMGRYEALASTRSKATELAGQTDSLISVKKADGTVLNLAAEVENSFYYVEKDIVRSEILKTKTRIDGRGLTDIRKISVETGVLPGAHGSALFTRGETQAMVALTLGSARDAQSLDSLYGEDKETFMMHYNFPPFSVGEIGQYGSPKRREIGHGNLARRGLFSVTPTQSEFPYTLRIVSEITESNGSSSMASVCGGCLAMMDGGVPIKRPVSGIAMGLIKEENDYAVLSDILGDEDHLGDMDFKVAGSELGITALQMDIKIAGITIEIMKEAIANAEKGRAHILSKMLEVLPASRKSLASSAPKTKVFSISPSKIKDVIGKGGSVIQEITKTFEVQIDITDDGVVSIFGVNENNMLGAYDKIMSITFVQEVNVGDVYEGKITKIIDSGAFVNLFSGKDGFIHISQLSKEFVKNINDIVSLGQTMSVKVVEVDQKTKRVKLGKV